MADLGGEDGGGPNLLVVVVDINPNQVGHMAWNNLKENALPP